MVILLYYTILQIVVCFYGCFKQTRRSNFVHNSFKTNNGIDDIRNDSKIVYSQDKSDGLELKTRSRNSGLLKFLLVYYQLALWTKSVDADLLMP
jgi:hypothetical protein